MRISRIYVDQPLDAGAVLELEVQRAHYVRNVLRLKSGAELALFNGTDDRDFSATLRIEGRKVWAEISSSEVSVTDSSLDSEVILGLSRSDHIDFSIQKCTELGVRHVSIFNAHHSQIPLNSAQREKRMAHWQAIAIKACEQCGRHRIPGITFYPQLKSRLEVHDPSSSGYLLDFDGSSLTDLLSAKQHKGGRFCLLIGPEGGLSEAEILMAREVGFASCRLGPRVLRTETAAIASLTILQAICGDIARQ